MDVGPVHHVVCPFTLQLSLVLINRPQRDGMLSWRWCTAATGGIWTHELASQVRARTTRPPHTDQCSAEQQSSEPQWLATRAGLAGIRRVRLCWTKEHWRPLVSLVITDDRCWSMTTDKHWLCWLVEDTGTSESVPQLWLSRLQSWSSNSKSWCWTSESWQQVWS